MTTRCSRSSLPSSPVLIIAGFAWMVYLTRDIGRMVKAVAGMAYQESEKTRAALPRRDS